MGIWRMDRATALHLTEHIMEMPEKFPLEHCPICGSDYLAEVGHEHGQFIDFEIQDVNENDEITPLKEANV